MRRARIDRLSGVRMATREIEAVAGAQRQVEPRLAELVERQRCRPGHATHRVARALERIPDAPALGAFELEDEDVVEVEVQLEPAGRRR